MQDALHMYCWLSLLRILIWWTIGWLSISSISSICCLFCTLTFLAIALYSTHPARHFIKFKGKRSKSRMLLLGVWGLLSQNCPDEKLRKTAPMKNWEKLPRWKTEKPRNNWFSAEVNLGTKTLSGNDWDFFWNGLSFLKNDPENTKNSTPEMRTISSTKVLKSS